MNRLAFLSLIFLFTVLGCSNDDNSSDSGGNTPELNGTWNLISVTGGFVGIDHNFDVGTIIWNFNESSNTIAVTNNNTDDSIEDILPTGIYNYSIITVGEVLEFIVDDVNRGNFEIITNQFTVNEPFRDGFRFTFSR